MINDLSELWHNVKNDFFYLELENRKYLKDDLNKLMNIFKKNIQAVVECRGVKIHIDIRDRLLFIVTFLSLIELKSQIVIVPSEVKPEDYYYAGGIFLSDNKDFNEGIFLKSDLNIKIGMDFKSVIDAVSDNTALYLYTSGSAGKAKLIPKRSVNLITELKELKNNLNVLSSDVFYFTMPLYHIYGLLFGLLLPLYSSSAIILDYHFSPESICDFVSRKKIDFFASIPNYYRMFDNLNLLSPFKNIKRLTSSSAPLFPDISKKFYENGSSIVEIYGSTETGGIAYRTGAVSEEWKLFSYVRITEQWNDYADIEYDSESRQTELCIVSPAISVEYDAEKGFNTGDIVALYGDKKFVLLGRNTRFVKIGGKRIDLNCIHEKIINLFKDNFNEAVNPESVYIGEKDQILYAIIDTNHRINSKFIKNELKKHLPSYNIPKMIIFESIPRNNMGKINKSAISELVTGKKIKNKNI